MQEGFNTKGMACGREIKGQPNKRCKWMQAESSSKVVEFSAKFTRLSYAWLKGGVH